MANFQQHDANAKLMWDLLTSRARKGSAVITYGEVKNAIGLDRFTQKYALEILQLYCELRKYPHLTSLVVLSGSGKPSRGNALSESHLTTEYSLIANFDWPAAPESFLSDELMDRFKESLQRKGKKASNQSPEGNHWLLQVNPKVWDISGYLSAGHKIDRWAISQHKNSIKSGERFILWLSGSKGGAIGWGRMGSKLDPNLKSPNDQYWEKPKSHRTEYFSLSVDDMWTSGQTMISAAAALFDAGVNRIGMLSLGRHVNRYGNYYSPDGIYENLARRSDLDIQFCANCDSRADVRPPVSLGDQYGESAIEHKVEVLLQNVKAGPDWNGTSSSSGNDSIGSEFWCREFKFGTVVDYFPEDDSIKIDFGIFRFRRFSIKDPALKWKPVS